MGEDLLNDAASITLKILSMVRLVQNRMRPSLAVIHK
jgi:hypothetical protein